MRVPACLFVLLCLGSAAGAATAKEEVVTIFEHRRITLAVPDGFALTQDIDSTGSRTVRLVNPASDVDLQLTFLPDPENNLLSSARARKELMVEIYQEFLPDSTEQVMQFDELDPHTGAGTYCTFTDAKLASAGNLPPGEFRRVTPGVKAWRGGCVLFKLFSNDVKSPGYLALMKLLRESVEEPTTGPTR